MKTLLFNTLLLSSTCLFTLSCKREKVDPYTFLTSKNWKRASVDKNPATNPPGFILYVPITDCNSDDIYKFGADGTYTISPSTNKCSVDDEVKINKYDIENKEIYIDGYKFPLYEVSENQIKFGMVVDRSTGWEYAVCLLE